MEMYKYFFQPHLDQRDLNKYDLRKVTWLGPELEW